MVELRRNRIEDTIDEILSNEGSEFPSDSDGGRFVIIQPTMIIRGVTRFYRQKYYGLAFIYF